MLEMGAVTKASDPVRDHHSDLPRQHHNGLLPQQAGRDQALVPLGGNSCSQETEDSGRHALQGGTGPANKMDSSSTGGQVHLQTVGQHYIDLFATFFNHQLPIYISLVPNPQAWTVEGHA